MTEDKIGAALLFDPLAEAEKITGQSYKEDKGTSALGLLMYMNHNQKKEQLLRNSDDSFYSMDFVGQMDLFNRLGFDPVYSEVFEGSSGMDTFVLLWHPDGLLATCESYGPSSRNSSTVYYNYQHRDGLPGWSLTSSGHVARGTDVWVGDHDAREGIRHNLEALWAEGEFLPVWVERPFLWLLNYSEKNVEGYDYDEINERKIAQLPEHVRQAITPIGESTS